MAINVDFAAIIMMEFLGVFSFLIAFLFLRQRQRIGSRQKEFMHALSGNLISEKGSGKCFSSDWVLDNIVYKRRKLFSATPLLIGLFTLILVLFYYIVGPQLISHILNLGYASVIAFIGVAILLWTDAFEAYSYTNALQKIQTKQLDKEDQIYIELAHDSLGKAFQRFVSMGITFALFGPFIPQIFDSFIYVFTLYTTVFFEASQVSLKALTAIGVVVVLVLPVLMLFLPEIVGRIIIRKGRSLANRILNHGNKQ